MGIQSSVNALMQQLYTIGAIGAGLREQKKQTKGQEKTANEAKIQTEIAAGNAPMKDGKVDPEWLQKRREEDYQELINDGIELSDRGKRKALKLNSIIRRGHELGKDDKEFYDSIMVQNYIKSFNDKGERLRYALDTLESAIEAQSTNSKLKNEVAGKVAKMSVKARTDSINKTKSNFNEHTASLIKYYGKGSENP